VALGIASAASARALAVEHAAAQGAALADDFVSAVAAQLPNRRELTLPEAITIAQGRYPGRVVRAQTIQQGNGAVHEIRIIGNDGIVHVVRVDARTGAVQ
jgi:uncharacterized membrane protein YkoI